VGYGLLLSRPPVHRDRSVADDGSAVLGEDHVHAVVAARPAVSEDLATEAARTAVDQARLFVGALTWHGDAHLGGTAGAGIHHAEWHIDWRRRAWLAAGIGAARVTAVPTMVTKASLSCGGRIEHWHRHQAGAEKAGCKKRGEFHGVLSRRQEESRRDGRISACDQASSTGRTFERRPRNRYGLPFQNTLPSFGISTSSGVSFAL